jgi:gamma-glutamylcyclotransferase (GGCT)/AIG2-like uncharacterized protein YtfP
MLYFSYGMNTNPDSMAYRCPGALSMGHARLLEHSFRFAHHADVVATPGSFVDGVLWEITAEHLTALDYLEGYPHYYNRSAKPVSLGRRILSAEVYYMNPAQDYYPPSEYYLNHIISGYNSHAVPTDQILNALELVSEILVDH